jgi:hypothetical protein
MRVSPDDYERMRSWFALVSGEAFPGVSEGQSPVAALDGIAARSPAKARDGLGMAIGDLIELTAAWSDEQIFAVDRKLRKADLPMLTEIRTRFSKAVQRVLRRGRITNEAEYYAVRNAAEFEPESAPHRQLIAAYEEQQSA